MFKQLGKLKNGTKFIYNNQTFIVTKSGFGSGKHVPVDFKKTKGDDFTTFSLPKYITVKVL
jgi:hypothetical protein